MEQVLGEIQAFLSYLFTWFTESELSLGPTLTITPSSIITSLVILFLFHWFSKLVQRVIKTRILTRFHLDQATEFMVLKMAHYGVISIALLAIVGLHNMSLTGLTVIAGLLSVGIGFGLQTLAANFISGLIILFEAPIKIGDWVDLGDLQGVVKSINLRYTGIETIDSEFILVPNQDLITKPFVNGSKGPPYIRIHTPVGVHYNSDVALVKEVLSKVAESHPLVLKTPCPEIRLTDFGDSSVNFDILTYLENPAQKLKVQSDLNYEVWWALKNNNVEIPYPQRDLHIRSTSVPLTATHPAPQQVTSED
jgi:potassium-dependent mechanosensitive channel